jgi:hypothetical protein
MKKKYMSAKEFREGGYLQEINRIIAHRLGIAICLELNENDDTKTLFSVWDCRDETAGITYHESVINKPEYMKKALKIKKELQEKDMIRYEKYGYTIQSQSEVNVILD